MLEWFHDALESSKQNSEHPIVLGHIPPGVASFNLKNHFNNNLQQILFSLLREYKPTINSMLLGHVHRDEFRLLPSDDPIVMYVGIGLSPVYTNNPGYRVIKTTINRKEGFVDATHYTFDLDKSNTQAKPVWLPSYTFSEAYGVSEITVSSLKKLSDDIFNDITLSSLYRWRTVGMYDSNALQIKCAITSRSNQEMLKCTGVESQDQCHGLNL